MPLNQNQIASAAQCASASLLLRSCEHVQLIRFYMNKFENKDPELCCMLHSMYMSKDKLEKFAVELNAAIEPVIQGWAAALQGDAEKAMKVE